MKQGPGGEAVPFGSFQRANNRYQAAAGFSQRLPALGHITSNYIQAQWRWRALRGAALERYQNMRAREQVAYAYARSGFYRAHWAEHDLRDWRNLPAVDKRLMMENFSRFNTRGIQREAALAVALRAERDRDFTPTIAGLTVGLSSGTSGHRGLFLVSPAEQAGWAGVILARALHRVQPGMRVAFFLRANSNLYEQIGGALIRFHYFDLMTPLDQAVKSLNAFQPHIIVGPPSLLGFLAEARERGALRTQPERLIAVAEVLEPQDHDRLAAVFAAPLHQIYQCTEGLLAVSCARGSLHLQEDIVAVQCVPLDERDPTRVTPIVTDLWRRAQPIIRYRLNDVLRIDPQPCACSSAFRVIQAIEGRSDDVCVFRQFDGVARRVFPDTIRRMILLASPAIQDYQAEQAWEGQLRIHLVIEPGADFATVAETVQASVQAILASYACQPADLEIVAGLPDVTPGVKRRRVKRLAPLTTKGDGA
jgi:phenylacetate-CoA ligase